jgi:hypothetical protein
MTSQLLHTVSLRACARAHTHTHTHMYRAPSMEERNSCTQLQKMQEKIYVHTGDSQWCAIPDSFSSFF